MIREHGSTLFRFSRFCSNKSRKISSRARCRRLRIVADRHPKDVGHCFTYFIPSMSFITSTERCSARKLLEGVMNSAFVLSHLKGMTRAIRFGGIERVDRRSPFPSWLNPQHDPFFPLHADRGVDRDAIQPGEEKRIPLERVEGLVGVQEGLLHHIPCIFRIVRQAHHRVEQTILIARHQLAKCGCVALSAFGNQALDRLHSLMPCCKMDAIGSGKVPETLALHSFMI